MGQRWNIRRRLVVISVLLSALVIAFAVALTLTTSSVAVNRQMQAALREDNAGVSAALLARLENAAATARSLAATLSARSGSPITTLWRTASNIMLDGDNIITRIGVTRPFRGGYQTVIFREPSPPSIISPLADFISNTPPSFEGYQEALNGDASGLAWYGPQRGFSSTQSVIVYAAPFITPGDSQAGVLWVEVSPQALGEMLGQIAAGDNEYGSARILTVPNGDIIAYAQPNETRMMRLGAAPRADNIAPVLQAAPPGRVATVRANPFDDGRPAYATSAVVPGTRWLLTTLTPAANLQRSVGESLFVVFFAALIGLIVLGILVYRFANANVTKPLSELAAAAQEIGSGDMRYGIGHQHRRDEIGRLAIALEDMKTNLADSYESLSMWGRTLEQRVEERTAEAEAARAEAQRNAAEAQAIAEELRAVYDASLQMVGESSLDIILAKLIERVPVLLRATYCAVWLVDENSACLRLVASSTPDQRMIGTSIGLDEGLAGRTLYERAPIIVDDYLQFEGRLGWIDPTLRKMLSVPLNYFGTVIGALIAGRDETGINFTVDDQRLLSLLANLVSPLVRNAQLFAQLDAAVKEAESANQVKTRFLASVTHELRTPLNLIINNMDFMRIGAFGDINEEQHARLDQTIRSAEHLLYLINDLLDVSKIEAGEMHLFLQPTDLYPVIEDTIDSALAMLDQKPDVTFTADISENLPEVEMDARRVRQILTNLLSNAVKFTERGEVNLSVQLRGEYVAFAVRDTGIGIPKEDVSRIFEAFERSGRAKALGIEGTGLGLAISRYLAEAHGGRLWVESEVGRGSTFYFTLPLRQRVKTAPVPAAQRPRENGARRSRAVYAPLEETVNLS